MNFDLSRPDDLPSGLVTLMHDGAFRPSNPPYWLCFHDPIRPFCPASFSSSLLFLDYSIGSFLEEDSGSLIRVTIWTGASAAAQAKRIAHLQALNSSHDLGGFVITGLEVRYQGISRYLLEFACLSYSRGR